MNSYGVAIQMNPLEQNFYLVLFNFKDFTVILEIWNFWFRVINNIENYVCVESSDCVGALPEPS